MAYNIITILLEGVHDAAFIYKILRSNDFNSCKKAIKDLPVPISGLLRNPKHFSDLNIEEMTYEIANRKIYPFDILNDSKFRNIVMLYPLQGVNNKNLRKKLIQTFDDLYQEDSVDYTEGNTFSILYFWDSDKLGIKNRIEAINEELNDFFKEIPQFTSNKDIITIRKIKIGVYIFTLENSEYGRLEDVLIPLMKVSNEDIFEKANNFLSIHEDTRLFCGKLEKEGDVIVKVNGIKYDYKKSLIGTICQLQKSGMNNTVCIKQTDYLNEDKILENQTCNDILDFINKVIK